MKPRVTLMHGWGYDASVWREVLPLLDGLDVEVADLGFFGRPALPQPCATPRIAVGHSLGALWWLALTDLPWTKLIAIAGFPRFTAAPDFPHAVAARVLERMRKRFAADPGTTLAEFQHAGGATGPALPVDPFALTTGLATLATTDGRACVAERRQDIFALAARNDAIVPAAMSAAAWAALPEEKIRWLDEGGHVLPLTRPADCAALIREAAT